MYNYVGVSRSRSSGLTHYRPTCFRGFTPCRQFSLNGIAVHWHRCNALSNENSCRELVIDEMSLCNRLKVARTGMEFASCFPHTVAK